MAKLTSTEYAAISDLSTAGGDVGRRALIPIDSRSTDGPTGVGTTAVWQTTSHSMSAGKLFDFGLDFIPPNAFAQHATTGKPAGFTHVNNLHLALQMTSAATRQFSCSWRVKEGWQQTQSTSSTNSAFITPTIFYAESTLITPATTGIAFRFYGAAYAVGDTVSTAASGSVAQTVTLPASTANVGVLQSYTMTTSIISVGAGAVMLGFELTDHSTSVTNDAWYFLGLGLTWSRP